MQGESSSGIHSEHTPDFVLNQALFSQIVKVQSIMDTHRASIKLQDDVIRALFEGLGTSAHEKADCLASLLIKKDRNWDGSLNASHVPNNFVELLKIYKENGMVTPQEWWLCIGTDDHPHEPQALPPSKEDALDATPLLCMCMDGIPLRRLQHDCIVCCEKCSKCKKPKREMISFLYISLIDQLQHLCRSEVYCHDFMGMWRARERWLGKETFEHPEGIHEVWDGEKMRLYQNFWNPEASWEAPVICQNENCRMAYRAFPPSLVSKELVAGWNEVSEMYEFLCSRCKREIREKRRLIQGDPRNFSLLLHWDGFQAASTTLKDSAVVEVVVLNGGKRSKVGAIPVLFLPLSNKELEKKHGDILCALLQPLILELENMFTNGIEVDYAYSNRLVHESLPSGKVKLRGMLMMCTGDHPAQCKLGQLKDGGKSFCRRCKAHACLQQDVGGSRYVFDQNRFQARHIPEKRNVEDMWTALCNAKRCATKEGKEDILRDAGLSGQSSLWRLYHLYAFDISKDLVYDIMHILSLNLFQKYIRKMMSKASTHTKRDIDNAVKVVAGTIPKSILNAGRWPKNPSRHYKMFKAEECQKFVQWCLPHVLNVVVDINAEDVQLGLLLIDIAHLFFSSTRERGWSTEDIKTCRSLLSSWRILSEEYEGANGSPLEHVAGIFPCTLCALICVAFLLTN